MIRHQPNKHSSVCSQKHSRAPLWPKTACARKKKKRITPWTPLKHFILLSVLRRTKRLSLSSFLLTCLSLLRRSYTYTEAAADIEGKINNKKKKHLQVYCGCANDLCSARGKTEPSISAESWTLQHFLSAQKSLHALLLLLLLLRGHNQYTTMAYSICACIVL